MTFLTVNGCLAVLPEAKQAQISSDWVDQKMKALKMFLVDFSGVTDPVVYVGVVEKGSAIVEISVEGVQGHSSKPPRESAIGVLAKAVAALVKRPIKHISVRCISLYVFLSG